MTTNDDKSRQSRAELTQLLYGDEIPWSERSLAFKCRWVFDRTWQRIADAWLVLTGRADIG